MNLSKVLLFYKKTSYDHYFLAGQKRSFTLKKLFAPRELKRFLDTHQLHYAALAGVQETLRRRGIRYECFCRGKAFDPSGFGLVITVGGDGTFLEAARVLKGQFVLGVNSNPYWSVGRFCAGTAYNFSDLLERLIAGRSRILVLQRMQIELQRKKYLALNDILACHQSPGAMSRYALHFRGQREQQRSSGVWISTAAGSTGAISSAGGRILAPQSKQLQYKPRELYHGRACGYHLKGGLIRDGEDIRITSLMREGVVYVDGCHICLPFVFGSTLKVSRWRHPLKVIWK